MRMNHYFSRTVCRITALFISLRAMEVLTLEVCVALKIFFDAKEFLWFKIQRWFSKWVFIQMKTFLSSKMIFSMKSYFLLKNQNYVHWYYQFTVGQETRFLVKKSNFHTLKFIRKISQLQSVILRVCSTEIIEQLLKSCYLESYSRYKNVLKFWMFISFTPFKCSLLVINIKTMAYFISTLGKHEWKHKNYI